ncbi:hypothetical protein KCP73_14445 [Salmonella enterica subsp. enterica]|nr:hypothetical protein KCP73_14445 [Salmonella enterica subsp. enterica]
MLYSAGSRPISMALIAILSRSHPTPVTLKMRVCKIRCRVYARDGELIARARRNRLYPV